MSNKELLMLAEAIETEGSELPTQEELSQVPVKDLIQFIVGENPGPINTSEILKSPRYLLVKEILRGDNILSAQKIEDKVELEAFIKFKKIIETLFPESKPTSSARIYPKKGSEFHTNPNQPSSTLKTTLRWRPGLGLRDEE